MIDLEVLKQNKGTYYPYSGGGVNLHSISSKQFHEIIQALEEAKKIIEYGSDINQDAHDDWLLKYFGEK